MNLIDNHGDGSYMGGRRHLASARLMVIGLLIGAPLLEIAAPAGAVGASRSAGWCAHHPIKAKSTPSCATTTGSGGGGSGGAGSAPSTVQIDPSPAVETSTSSFAVVVQVEASPSFAGDLVDLSSSQLDASCAIDGFARPPFNVSYNFPPSPLVIGLGLDDDGNATTSLFGENCAPGTDEI